MPLDRGGFVYLMRHPEAGLFKIGRTIRPGDRERAIQKRAGELTEVVHLIDTDDAARLEAELHRVYREYRSAGEWFRLPEEAVKAIKATERVVYAGLLTNPLRKPSTGVNLAARVSEAFAARVTATAETLGLDPAAFIRMCLTENLGRYEVMAKRVRAGMTATPTKHFP